MNRLDRDSGWLARRLVAPPARIALSVLLLAGGAVGAAAGPAAASTTDGTLTVEVLRDFFGTGVVNATMDVPQRGMKVKVSDPAGHMVSGVTDATGKVVVSPSAVLSGGGTASTSAFRHRTTATCGRHPPRRRRTTSTASRRSWTCRTGKTPPW